MADVKQPKSIPCRFEEAWVGKCKKPSTNGWCSKHENKKCSSCGNLAVRTCDNTSGPLCCGVYLCASCQHSLNGSEHVSKEVYHKQWEDKKREEKEKELSRNSPTRRLDKKTGLPLNLFEFLKGNWKEEGYRLEKCYFLHIQHGLDGFFPAIVKEEKRVIITTDKELLTELWKLLPPRRSEMDSFIGYVHEEKGIVYRESKDQYDQEEIKAGQLLDRQNFIDLLAKQEKPFGWAPGLITDDMSKEEFIEAITAASKEFG